uniref:Uncharacterized protein n=1 Tax=Oryza brachyantha TaxID=4533 RepID=J3M9T8_ORYBR
MDRGHRRSLPGNHICIKPSKRCRIPSDILNHPSKCFLGGAGRRLVSETTCCASFFHAFWKNFCRFWICSLEFLFASLMLVQPCLSLSCINFKVEVIQLTYLPRKKRENSTGNSACICLLASNRIADSGLTTVPPSYEKGDKRWHIGVE